MICISCRPYYIVPDGKVGHDAYAVIRETIRSLDKVALARVVLTNREHVIALEARDKGLMGTLLRYPYEVRKESRVFRRHRGCKDHQGDARSRQAHRRDRSPDISIPIKFEDHYEAALQDLLNKKQKGLPIEKAARQTGGNVFNLMDALKASLKGGGKASEGKPAPARKAKAKAPAKRKAS